MSVTQLSKKIIFYQTIYPRISRSLVLHIHNHEYRLQIENIFDLELNYLVKWGMSQEDAESFVIYHKSYIVINLIKKLQRSYDLQEYIAQKQLMPPFDKKFRKRIAIKICKNNILQSMYDKKQLDNVSSFYGSDFGQTVETLSSELTKLKKDSKQDDKLFGRKGKGFYAKNIDAE